MMKLPVYLNCYFFFDTKNDKTAYAYKIDESHIHAHPFQLFKRKDEGSGSWVNLSVYASVEDAVKTLLKELLSEELSNEIDHGQATVNPDEIMRKIDQGERSIAIYGSTNNAAFRLELDVVFGDLVERK
jgi:hypothetical protein